MMRVTLLGTGGAWPDADRSAPAFLVQHEDVPFLVDCGGGTCHQLMKVNVPPPTLSHILLTHCHIDHCVEFPALVFGAYLTGKKDPFYVFGPSGTEHFTTSVFRDTYEFAVPMMKKLRKVDIDVQTKEIDAGLVTELDGLRIDALPVKHGIPTLAYRFAASGKTVVLSGDTAPCSNIVELARDADLLILECSFPQDAGEKPGHCIPSQAGAIARDANARSLLLVHLFPPCKGHEDAMLQDVKAVYTGPVTIGEDLQQITL